MLKIDEISNLSGLSKRSIRYYESKGLLEPKRSEGNYRLYDEKEIVRLYMIRLLKELDLSIEDIKDIVLDHQSYEDVLSVSLKKIKSEVQRKNKIIFTVEKIINKEKKMTEKSVFDQFKKSLIDQNNQQFGEEVKTKYGEKSLTDSNKLFMALSKEQYQDVESLNAAINEMLKISVENQLSPNSNQGIMLGKMHHKWLMYYWKEYSKDAHEGLANMYVEDERFKKYYEDIVVGGATYIKEAILAYINSNQ